MIKAHKSPTSVPTELIHEDNTTFDKQFLFKIKIEPNATALEFKQRILEAYNLHLITLDPTASPLQIQDVRVRNPKTDDIGDVISDNSTLEN